MSYSKCRSVEVINNLVRPGVEPHGGELYKLQIIYIFNKTKSLWEFYGILI